MTRKVTSTATVPLEGNAYAVNPALTGRRVELRYDPEDMTRVRCVPGRQARRDRDAVNDRPARAPRRPAGRPPRPGPDGIDYLGLVAAAHDDEAGAGAKIDFAQLPMLTGHDQQERR